MHLYAAEAKDYGFWIILEEGFAIMDCDIAVALNLTHQEYKEILINNNGYYVDNNSNWVAFYSKEDANRAIEALTPFLILATLIGE